MATAVRRANTIRCPFHGARSPPFKSLTAFPRSCARNRPWPLRSRRKKRQANSIATAILTSSRRAADSSRTRFSIFSNAGPGESGRILCACGCCCPNARNVALSLVVNTDRAETRVTLVRCRRREPARCQVSAFFQIAGYTAFRLFRGIVFRRVLLPRRHYQ